MRTKSKKPGKQRLYEYEVSKNEIHKLMSAPLSKKLQEEKGFRSLPVRQGDTVMVVRGDHEGKSGKVSRTDPSNQRIFIDGISGEKTDASEIAIPIHPSNVYIEKYDTSDRKRMELINRRIEDEEAKIDIESVLAEAEEEEEDLIEFDEDEFEDEALLDEELLDDEFDLVDEDEVLIEDVDEDEILLEEEEVEEDEDEEDKEATQ